MLLATNLVQENLVDQFKSGAEWGISLLGLGGFLAIVVVFILAKYGVLRALVRGIFRLGPED